MSLFCTLLHYNGSTITRPGTTDVLSTEFSVAFPPSNQYFWDVAKTRNGERGMGNGERGTGNGKRGAGSGEPGAGSGER